MKKIIFLILILILYSCASTGYIFSSTVYKVDMDSYSTNKPVPNNYYIDIYGSTDEFLNAEVESYIEKLMTNAGLTRIYEKKPGTYIIACSFSMNQQNVNVTRVYPIQGITGTSTRSNTKGDIDVYGNSAYGSAKTTERTTYNRGTVGYGSYQQPVTKYSKSISLMGGVKGNKTENIDNVVLWKIEAGTWTGDNDLRKAIPFILAGCAKNINKNSKGVISKEVYSNDYYYKLITKE